MLGLLSAIFLVFTTVDTLQNITHVKIYNQVGDIKVIGSGMPFLEIREYSKDTTSEVFQVKKKIKNQTLTVEIKPSRSCSDCRVEVILGIDTLKSLNIEVTSGNIDIKETYIEELYASIMSGDADINGSLKNLDIEILSGDLKIKTEKIDSLDISVSAGDVIADFDSTVELGKISILSGNLRLRIPKNQSLIARLSQKQDTVKHVGKGHLEIKITSGNLKILNKEY